MIGDNATMPEYAAHEAESGEEIQAWHEAAYEEYEAALDAYRAACDPHGQGSVGVDPAIKAAYEEARDTLVAGTQYWRQVGEQTGVRSGIVAVTNNDDEGLVG